MRTFFVSVTLSLVLLGSGCSSDPLAVAEDLREESSEVLISAIEGEDPQQRVRAAVAMGRIESRSYAPALVGAVASEEPALRNAALFSLGQLAIAEGNRLTRTVFATLARTAAAGGDEDSTLLAIEALGKLGEPGQAYRIQPFLLHDSPRIRAEAALAIFRSRFVPTRRDGAAEPPPLPEAVTAALIEVFDDEVAEVRRMAVYAVSRYGEPSAVDALLLRLPDEDEWVRLFAARALGRSGRRGGDSRSRRCSRRCEPPRAHRGGGGALDARSSGRDSRVAPHRRVLSRPGRGRRSPRGTRSGGGAAPAKVRARRLPHREGRRDRLARRAASASATWPICGPTWTEACNRCSWQRSARPGPPASGRGRSSKRRRSTRTSRSAQPASPHSAGWATVRRRSFARVSTLPISRCGRPPSPSSRRARRKIEPRCSARCSTARRAPSGSPCAVPSSREPRRSRRARPSSGTPPGKTPLGRCAISP